MSDEPASPPILDPTNLMPFDSETWEGDETARSLDFLYIGEGLTAAEFTSYVQQYDFGTIPPDFVIIHHTAVPGTVYTSGTSGQIWDAGESGLSEAQIKDHRQKQLDVLRNYYRDQLNWDRGPHLYIDDRYIWLFTPMREPGIHATWGNSMRDGGNHLHYSIGIEVVGNYENKAWPPAVAALVGHAVAVLKKQLGTFELRYMYEDPNSKPGLIVDGDGKARCAHPDRLKYGGIASHRDYNKPSCPGTAITESFYLGAMQAAWDGLTDAAPGAPLTLASPLLGLASGRRAQVVNYIKAQLPPDSEYKDDVETIVGLYWKYAPGVGVDPFLAAVQCVQETNALRSHGAGRPRRNPANLGVTDANPDGESFESWDVAVPAHLGRLLAFALADSAATEAQQELMRRNSVVKDIKPENRGAASTLAGLAGRWNDDLAYPAKLVAMANLIGQS